MIVTLTELDRARARAYIERRTIPVPWSGCRFWLGAVRSTGYGAVTWYNDGVREQWDSHRLAYVAFIGPIPDDLQVCHRCDIKICGEWTHYFLGTKQDNADDASAKGLLSRKLSIDDVQTIRGLHGKFGYGKLAQMYGVSKTLIAQIVRRDRWRLA